MPHHDFAFLFIVSLFYNFENSFNHKRHFIFLHLIDYETFSLTFAGWKYDILSQWKGFAICQEAYPQNVTL
jgi:hypothetical protein